MNYYSCTLRKWSFRLTHSMKSIKVPVWFNPATLRSCNWRSAWLERRWRTFDGISQLRRMVHKTFSEASFGTVSFFASASATSNLWQVNRTNLMNIIHIFRNYSREVVYINTIGSRCCKWILKMTGLIKMNCLLKKDLEWSLEQLVECNNRSKNALQTRLTASRLKEKRRMDCPKHGWLSN